MAIGGVGRITESLNTVTKLSIFSMIGGAVGGLLAWVSSSTSPAATVVCGAIGGTLFLGGSTGLVYERCKTSGANSANRRLPWNDLTSHTEGKNDGFLIRANRGGPAPFVSIIKQETPPAAGQRDRQSFSP